MNLLVNVLLFVIIAILIIVYLFFKYKYKFTKADDIKYVNKSLNPKFLFTEKRNTSHYTLDIFPNQKNTEYVFKIKVYDKKMEKELKKEVYTINPSEEFFIISCIDWVFMEDKAYYLEGNYKGHALHNGKKFSYEYLDRRTAQSQ